jgi:hypothetical protein
MQLGVLPGCCQQLETIVHIRKLYMTPFERGTAGLGYLTNQVSPAMSLHAEVPAMQLADLTAEPPSHITSPGS